MPDVNFSPEKDGFHFVNYFQNVVKLLPNQQHPIVTNGRCGGMSFAALDLYYAHRPVPPYKGADLPPPGVPPDGSPLSDYIYKRQIDSFLVPSAVNLLFWTALPDDTRFFIRGVTDRTKLEEFPRIQASINQGQPVPLCLIVAADFAHLGDNHQVVAYGYDGGSGAEPLTVHIYDVNFPDEPCKLVSNGAEPGFSEWHGDQKLNEVWRGFFVQDYMARRPPSDLSALVPAPQTAPVLAASPFALAAQPAPVSRKGKQLTVRFKRVTFRNEADVKAKDAIALNLAVNNQVVRWPATGTKPIAHGKSYALKKAIRVTAGGADTVSIAATIADDERYTLLAESGTTVGSATAKFGRARKWGIGEHELKSTGMYGGYTIDYSVEEAG